MASRLRFTGPAGPQRRLQDRAGRPDVKEATGITSLSGRAIQQELISWL